MGQYRVVLGVRLYGTEKFCGKAARAAREYGKRGGRTSWWSDEAVALLKKEYPLCDSFELANKLGVSLRALRTKASSLGIKKDEGFLKELRYRNFLECGKA